MSYTPTTWLDRIVTHARRFTITNVSGDIYDLTPETGTVTEAGTPVNAANLNNLENGLADHTLAEMPHRFIDTDTTNIYRYGFKQEDGHVVFVYEEVV